MISLVVAAGASRNLEVVVHKAAAIVLAVVGKVADPIEYMVAVVVMVFVNSIASLMVEVVMVALSRMVAFAGKANSVLTVDTASLPHYELFVSTIIMLVVKGEYNTTENRRNRKFAYGYCENCL